MRDLNAPNPDIILENDSQELKKYYINFQPIPKTLNRLISNFDDDGVPLNNAYIDVKSPKLHYYPISIGQYGLSIFHAYLVKKEEEHKEHFLRIADWFLKNGINDKKLGTYWLTDVDKPEFNVYKPWKSAFTQSRALSILLRAWQITNNEGYLETAKKALIPYEFHTTEGGVKVSSDNTDVIYEEYVAEQPTRILDGAIFSLYGLYDAVRVMKGVDNKTYEKAHSLFEQGVKGLSHWLPKYDMGYWVYYNRCEIKNYPANDPCTIGYLKLVVGQLLILHSITNQNVFKEYSNLFNSYLMPTNILRMYIEKYKALKKLNRL